MASRHVTFHPDAEREYLTSLDWYRERSIEAALDFEKEFQHVIARIREAPERWPSYSAACRRYVFRQFPFSIVYQVFSDEILVVAVAHGHRRPGYWKKRLGWKGADPREQ